MPTLAKELYNLHVKSTVGKEGIFIDMQLAIIGFVFINKNLE